MATWTLNGPEGDFLTKEDVASLLRCTVRHLENLIARGEFPRGALVGKRLLWSGLDLAAYLYLRSRCRAGPPDDDPADEEEAGPPAPRKGKE